MVPVLADKGRNFWFHSRYSPSKEASRAVQTVAPSQLLVTAGIGNGAHIRALLDICSPQAIVVVAEPPEILAEILSRTSLETILSDDRIRVVPPDNTVSELRKAFVPLFTRGLNAFALQGIHRALPELTETCNQSVQSAADALSEDVTTQSHHGLLWMRNTILNFPQAAARNCSLELPRRVTIAGAGPSLEKWIEAGIHTEAVVATDTAAPSLQIHGVRPEAVVSVDPALYSYHHILCGSPPQVPWLVDVAAHPAIWRERSDAIPVTSAHPLLRLLCEDEKSPEWPQFSGSDVTQAAISIVTALGATDVHTAGTDYAYPREQGYARGSYIDTLFASVSNRLSTPLTHQYRFCYRSPNARRDSDGAVRTPALESTRRATSGLMRSLGHSSRRIPGVSNHPPGVRWAVERLHRIAEELSWLSIPAETAEADYYRSLNAREKTLVNACIPSALSLSHRDALEWHEALESAIGRYRLLVANLHREIP